MGFLSVQMNESLSCAFPWALLFVCLFVFVQFQCVSFSFLIIFYYSLEACLFSNERQEGDWSSWEGSWETVVRIHYVRKKNLFSIIKENGTHGVRLGTTTFTHWAISPALKSECCVFSMCKDEQHRKTDDANSPSNCQQPPSSTVGAADPGSVWSCVPSNKD